MPSCSLRSGSARPTRHHSWRLSSDQTSVKATASERRQARIDLRDDYDRDRYVSVGHDVAKVDLALLLENDIRDITGWTTRHFKNQITFDRDGQRVLRIGLWTRHVRLEANNFWTEPRLDPFPYLDGRRSDSKPWYWFIRSAEEWPGGLASLVSLLDMER